MTLSIVVSVIAFGVASNLDNLGVGISYGVSRTRVTVIANLVIAMISAIATGISVGAGGLLTHVASSWSTHVLGSVMMSMVGLWIACRAVAEGMATGQVHIVRLKSLSLVISVLKEPSQADADHSGVIDLRESVILGLALALNCIAGGVAAGLMRLPAFATALSVAVFSCLTVCGGWQIGSTIGSHWLGKKAGVLAGLILLFMALMGLRG